MYWLLEYCRVPVRWGTRSPPTQTVTTQARKCTSKPFTFFRHEPRQITIMESFLRKLVVKMEHNSISMLCRAGLTIVTIWAALHEKVPNVLNRCNPSILLLVWHRLFIYIYFFFFFKKKKFLDFFFGKVGVIPKEGRARPRVPVLLLVWQWLRTLGTFLRNAAHIFLFKELPPEIYAPQRGSSHA